MCRVVSWIVGRDCLLWPVFSWQNSVSLCPASFCTPRPNLPVTLGISWLPTFSFQSSMLKRTSFFLVLVLEGLVGPHRTFQLQLSALVVGAQTWITVTLNGLLWKWTKIVLSFLRLRSTSVIEVINLNCTVLIGRISHIHIWRQDCAKCPEQGNKQQDRNHSWPFWSLLLVPDLPITSPIFSVMSFHFSFLLLLFLEKYDILS